MIFDSVARLREELLRKAMTRPFSRGSFLL